MSTKPWRTYAGRFIAAALIVLLLGLFTEQWAVVLLLAMGAYLCWLMYNIWQLHRWLIDNEAEPPESRGIWADIFDHINRLQKRSRKHREQQKATIQQFQSVTNAFPDACLVLDEHDVLTWFNESARQLLGLKIPEDLGQAVTNLVRDPDFANWLAVQDKVNSRLELPNPLDSNIYLSASAVRYRENQRLIILRDITDIHNQEQIRHDFVANVSHELRTPLTVLSGYLESMQDDCKGEVKKAVKRMSKQARQMQALLNDLLELSRLQSDEIESEQENIDVPAMLVQLKEEADEISQGNHELTFNVEPALWLRGVPVDIESAFRNLVQNAINYTLPDGKIRVSWQSGDGGLLFKVEDSGSGIPKKDIARLTERFYRVGSDRSRQTGGTGLGLSIVKHILNAHQAKLHIESELGAGSCFSCTFPEERRASPPPEPSAP